MATLRRITEAGLKSYQTAVQITRKTSPNYDLAVRQLEAAQYHYDTTRAIEAKAAKQNFIRNRYDGTDSLGQKVKAGAGFARKEDARWVTYSWDQVVELLGIKIEGLPEIPA